MTFSYTATWTNIGGRVTVGSDVFIIMDTGVEVGINPGSSDMSTIRVTCGGITKTIDKIGRVTTSARKDGTDAFYYGTYNLENNIFYFTGYELQQTSQGRSLLELLKTMPNFKTDLKSYVSVTFQSNNPTPPPIPPNQNPGNNSPKAPEISYEPSPPYKSSENLNTCYFKVNSNAYSTDLDSFKSSSWTFSEDIDINTPASNFYTKNVFNRGSSNTISIKHDFTKETKMKLTLQTTNYINTGVI